MLAVAMNLPDTEPSTETVLCNTQSSSSPGSADKVGRLMDLVGELSLSVSETIRSSDLEGLELTEFEKSAHRLMMVVREVQDAAAELRLVPIGDVFRRMRRMVRELERTTGKEIDLVLEGEDTQIDKVVADRLYEPLVHVVRNCADHGLEAPSDREALGKPRKGRITLAARRSAATSRLPSPMMGVVSTAKGFWPARASAACSAPRSSQRTAPCGR